MFSKTLVGVLHILRYQKKSYMLENFRILLTVNTAVNTAVGMESYFCLVDTRDYSARVSDPSLLDLVSPHSPPPQISAFIKITYLL